jgi:hypothetical protein
MFRAALGLSPGHAGWPHLPRLPQPLRYNCSMRRSSGIGVAIMAWKATLRRWPEVLLAISVIGLAYNVWYR